MLLELHDIEKAFNGKPVLRAITLQITEGEIVVLLGPSGCGKTTLLRIIAGLEQADHGRALLNGRDLAGLPIHQRGFGMVFQDYALFPHKDVYHNVAFGLRMMNWDQPAIAGRVEHVLALVGLEGFGRRRIHELSGGEKQRVALARSLAPQPRLLLLDEPLGALDRALRERLMLELRTILKRAGHSDTQPGGVTTVYVTHDQAEAFAIADRIVVMNEGHIEQVGTPDELFRCPATAFVARFLGMDNVFDGDVVSRKPLVVESPLGRLEAVGRRSGPEPGIGDRVTVLIRPEAGELDPAGDHAIEATLRGVSFRGRFQIATFTVGAGDASYSLKLEFESTVNLPDIGSSVKIALHAGSIVLLESC